MVILKGITRTLALKLYKLDLGYPLVHPAESNGTYPEDNCSSIINATLTIDRYERLMISKYIESTSQVIIEPNQYTGIEFQREEGVFISC